MVKFRGFNQALQSVPFRAGVGDPRKNKVVDAGPASVPTDHLQTLGEVFKRVVARQVVVGVPVFAGRIHAHADALQTSGAQGFHSVGLGPVGVDVQNALGRFGADFLDGLHQGFPHQQRFSFAALPKRQNGVGGAFDVVQGHFGDFVRVGDEFQPKMGVVDVFVLLQGNAAQARGIAGGGSGNGAFPPV
jgi:hypothetical protein